MNTPHHNICLGYGAEPTRPYQLVLRVPLDRYGVWLTQFETDLTPEEHEVLYRVFGRLVRHTTGQPSPAEKREIAARHDAPANVAAYQVRDDRREVRGADGGPWE